MNSANVEHAKVEQKDEAMMTGNATLPECERQVSELTESLKPTEDNLADQERELEQGDKAVGVAEARLPDCENPLSEPEDSLPSTKATLADQERADALAAANPKLAKYERQAAELADSLHV